MAFDECMENPAEYNYAKNSCSDGLILCEGNVDVVSLHQAGFENAVATLGTAITPEHARLMKKYTSKVFIAYDSDSAGRRATEKAISVLGDVGIDTKLIKIKNAKDPDEYIKKFGKLAFRELIDGSLTVYEYKIDSVISKYDIEKAEDKAAAARELCSECAKITSKIEKDLFISKIAKAIGVSERSVEYDVSKAGRALERQQKKELHENVIVKTSGITDRVNRDFAKNPRAARLEEIVLGMMLYCPELLEKAKARELIKAEDFFTEYSKKLFKVMNDAMDSGGFDISVLNAELTPDEVSRAVKLMTAREKLANTDAIFFDTLNELKEETGKKSDGGLDELVEKIRKARGE